MFKLKVVTNEDNYKEVVIKRAIILCWFLLFVCFIIKIFGGNFFNIVCNNERFIKICNYIDNTWLYYLVGYINYVVAGYIYTFAIIGKINNYKKSLIVIFLVLTLCYLTKFISLTLSLFVDYIFYFMIFCPFMCKLNGYTLKQSLIRSLIGLILVNVFQLSSLFIKNISKFKIMSNNCLIQLIYSIDYFIMLFLYLFYSLELNLKKEVK